MRAITRRRAGGPDKLQIVELDIPQPKANQVLVEVHAATVTSGDTIMLRVPKILWYLMKIVVGFGMKSILGTEFAGEIIEVGSEVTQYKIGDRVFGATTKENSGGHCEYLCVNEDGIMSTIPENVTYLEAASLPIGAMTAIQLLRKHNIEKHKSVMVYGASGSVGTFAVQLAKHWGAEVTAVCSASNVEMVTSLGADIVLDYRSDEFVSLEASYDLIFDAVGKLSRADRKRIPHTEFGSIREPTKEKKEVMDEIRDLVTAGKLITYIDKQYTIDEIRDAYTYVKSGRKRGNVVISIIE
ncbi:MAG: NAD(P)-dependent alcohol dehydrogenase [Candidatus Kariarchaeaceae archaeon]|jgi:NADPH:quinone reductase-like Zn-dependent oxidoreductase